MTTAAQKPLACVSLDLDNLWSYMKTREIQGWSDRPTYIPEFVPAVLDVLDELGLKITFFLVGADAESELNKPYLRRLVEAGHEVGNHSFEHEVWLHTYDRTQLAHELGRAEASISEATGQKPRGFRGPGFSWSPLLLEMLIERGYLFDASTFPTFIGPLARWYYFRGTEFDQSAQKERELLFGKFSEGFRPNGPYLWSAPHTGELLEIPVTTVPIVRTPFHLSYLLYIGRLSPRAMSSYLRLALALCKGFGVGPSMLLHPLDLLSSDEAPELRFFPGMDLPTARKRELFVQALQEMKARFDLVPMNVYAEYVLMRNDLRSRQFSGSSNHG